MIAGTEIFTGETAAVTTDELKHHTLVVGTTGRGKTVGVLNLVESAIAQGIPVVFSSTEKATNEQVIVSAISLSVGLQVLPFQCGQAGGNCAYRSATWGDFSSKAHRTMAIRQRWTEPHYETLSASFMQTSFKILNREKGIDLVQIASVLSIRSLLGVIRKLRLPKADRQALAEEVLDQEEAEKSGISSLRAEIRDLANSSLRELFDTQTARQNGRGLSLPPARTEGAVRVFFFAGVAVS